MNAYKTCTTLDGPYTEVRCSACDEAKRTCSADTFKFCWNCGVKFGPEPKKEPTPGEWFYQKMNGRIYSVVNPAFSTGSVTIAEIVATEVDGHLMAASKKLLAACRSALQTGIPNYNSALEVSQAIAEAEKGKQ